MNTNIEQELQNIKERNMRVEQDKAWETSWTRKIFIAIVTYIIASIWLYIIDESGIFLKAVVPTVGYLLSTLSIPILKQIWLKSKSN